MKVTLVRHGETEENFLNKLFTITNCPMNDTGRRQCMRLKNVIKKNNYDYCFTDCSSKGSMILKWPLLKAILRGLSVVLPTLTRKK